MKLTRIKAKNLKARTFDHKLGATNIIVGPNNSGKTAVSDAIKLALLGYVPGLPKTNAGIFKLSSGSTMSVMAEFDGHSMVQRKWTQKGDRITCNEEGVDPEIAKTPIVLLDATEYFARSPRAQAELVFSLMDLKTLSVKTPIEAIPTDGLPARTQESLQRILEWPKESDNVQAWIESALERAADELKMANADVVRYQKTTQGVTALGLAENAEDPAAIVQEIEKAKFAVESLIAESARATEAAQRQQGVVERKRAIAAGLAEASAAGTPPNEPATDLMAKVEAAMGAAVAADNALLKAHALQSTATAATSRKMDIEEAMRTQRIMAARLPELHCKVQTIGDLDKQVDALNEAAVTATHTTNINVLANVRAQYNALLEAEAKKKSEFNELFSATKCPMCGLAGDDWKEKMEARHGEEMQELTAAIRAKEADMQAASEALDQSQRAHDQMVEKLRAIQAEQRAQGDLRLELAKAENAQNNLATLEGELARLDVGQPPSADQVAHLLNASVKAKDELAHWKDALRRRQAHDKAEVYRTELAAMPAIDDDIEQRAYQLSCDLELAREKIRELQVRHDQAGAVLADRRRIAQAQTEVDEATKRAEAISDAANKLREARSAMITEAFRPFLNIVNHFTKGIIPTLLEYRDGEIGRFEGANWIPVGTFGGSHTAVTYAGLQAALGALAPAKIVIVDELGRFDRANKKQFIENVHAVIENNCLDQFIGIDVDPRDYSTKASEWLTVIRTEAQK